MVPPLDHVVIVVGRPETTAEAVGESVEIFAEVATGTVDRLTDDSPEVFQRPDLGAVQHIYRGHSPQNTCSRDVSLLGDPALDGTWTVFFPRLVSDSTLLDALRAALATGHGPDDLLSFTTEPDEDWEEELAAINHSGLRAHLGPFCTDGEEGLMPLFDDEATAGGLEDEGCEAVAAWEDGHGQLAIRVVRLSDHVADPRPS